MIDHIIIHKIDLQVDHLVFDLVIHIVDHMADQPHGRSNSGTYRLFWTEWCRVVATGA